MTTLRRLAHSPAPRRLVAAYRLELLAVAAMCGGILGQLNGWG